MDGSRGECTSDPVGLSTHADTGDASAAQSLRIQLIHPPQRISAANLVSSVTIPPLGTAYLAATLEHAGHRVTVADAIGEGLDNTFQHDGRTFRGLDFSRIVERIDTNADVIGMGVMFSCAWPALRKLVRQIRDRAPHTPLVLGGEHPTALTELVFEQSPVDFAVLGEGEETLLELCDRIAYRRDPSDVAGLALRDGDTPRINPRRSRIRDIDAIPLPAWQHFDIEAYIRFGQPHGSADGHSMPMLATRGCPFQCTFCGSPGMWGTSWRARDPVKVVDEMEGYMHRYGANDFHFEDLTAIVRKDWVLAFSQEILRRNLKISWQLPSGTRSEALDREVAEALHASGCRQFTYALESGSPEILRKVKKRIKIDRVFGSAKEAINADIRVQGAFIYGFPGETLRQMWQTFRTILRCAFVGFHEITICALQPLPNTEMFRAIDSERAITIDDNYLDSIFGYLGLGQQKSWNPRISSFALRIIILVSFASFFTLSFVLRPARAFALMRGLVGARSQGKFARILKGMILNVRRTRTQPASLT
ncbi:MAG: B12-binding domain-containing radical SAM protein [Phycisphaerales bacterium]|nr:MAG: B12-binding domain-containing radical SAM protein [Phycisphaerales bacterium]